MTPDCAVRNGPHLVLSNLLERPGAREEGLAAPLLLEVEADAHDAAGTGQGGWWAIRGSWQCQTHAAALLCCSVVCSVASQLLGCGMQPAGCAPVCGVERFLHAVPVVDVYVYVQHPALRK